MPRQGIGAGDDDRAVRRAFMSSWTATGSKRSIGARKNIEPLARKPAASGLIVRMRAGDP